MRSMSVVGVGMAALIAVGTVVHGAQPKAKRAKAPPPAYAKAKEDPALPRVLLIGDSISIGYTIPVREALAGKANVQRPATNCGPTISGLKGLDKVAGRRALGRDPLQLGIA